MNIRHYYSMILCILYYGKSREQDDFETYYNTWLSAMLNPKSPQKPNHRVDTAAQPRKPI